MFAGRFAGLVEAAGFIVIGQSKNAHALLGCAGDEITGCQDAIRRRRMAVKIENHTEMNLRIAT